MNNIVIKQWKNVDTYNIKFKNKHQEEFFILEFFSKEPREKIIDHLLLQNIPLDKLNKEYSLLYYAYNVRNNMLLQKLIENGIQLNRQVLEQMVESGDKEYIEQFLENGHDIDFIKVYLCDSKIEELLEKYSIEIIKINKNKDQHEIISLLYPNTDDKNMELLTTRAWTKNLFYLDKQYWNSVDQYIYYNLNKDNSNGQRIKQFRFRSDMDNFLLLQNAGNTKNVSITNHYEKTPYSYLKGKKLLETATKAKFYQNKYLLEILKTINKPLLNIDFDDTYGYINNNLGNVLMEIRMESIGIPKQILPSNNLRFSIYKPKPNFYIVRGNPNEMYQYELDKLSSYRTKKGYMIKGKYNPKLIDGGGWLVPRDHGDELHELIFETYPEYIKIRKLGKIWIDTKLEKIINVARKVVKTENKTQIPQSIIKFVIQKYYDTDIVAGKKVHVPLEFSITLSKILNKYGLSMNLLSQELLWEFISNLSNITLENIILYEEMKERLDKIDILFNDFMYKVEEQHPPLDNFVYYFITAFRKVFDLMKEKTETEKLACMITLDMIMGNKNYEKILHTYRNKIKYDKKGRYDDEITMFQERFDIHVHYIDEILEILPKVDKKCKLLILTSIEYIENLDNEETKLQLFKEFYTVS